MNATGVGGNNNDASIHQASVINIHLCFYCWWKWNMLPRKLAVDVWFLRVIVRKLDLLSWKKNRCCRPKKKVVSLSELAPDKSGRLKTKTQFKRRLSEDAAVQLILLLQLHTATPFSAWYWVIYFSWLSLASPDSELRLWSLQLCRGVSGPAAEGGGRGLHLLEKFNLLAKGRSGEKKNSQQYKHNHPATTACRGLFHNFRKNLKFSASVKRKKKKAVIWKIIKAVNV